MGLCAFWISCWENKFLARNNRKKANKLAFTRKTHEKNEKNKDEAFECQKYEKSEAKEAKQRFANKIIIFLSFSNAKKLIGYKKIRIRDHFNFYKSYLRITF